MPPRRSGSGPPTGTARLVSGFRASRGDRSWGRPRISALPGAGQPGGAGSDDNGMNTTDYLIGRPRYLHPVAPITSCYEPARCVAQIHSGRGKTNEKS
jgi:hypothetical protein